MRGRLAVNIAVACAVGTAACSDKEPAGPGVAPPDTTTRVEARALWITRYDWVSAAEISADRQRGRMGTDPGWDPLQIALTAARAKGLELHAWLNALYAWPVTTTPQETTPRHALLEHPEWFMVNASGQPIYENNTTNRWLSPAVADARSRLAAVAADIARRYGPDGLQLDFIRYPGATPVDRPRQWRACRSMITAGVQLRARFVKCAIPSSASGRVLCCRPPCGAFTGVRGGRPRRVVMTR